MTILNTVLADLETAIKAESFEPPEPLPIDKWLASSVFQKAVRRSHTETAVRAAASLWLQDRQNFWRRLHTCALEDVGIGDVDAVVKTLAATAASTWRRRVGDLQVGLHLTRLLCNAVKSRLADEVYIAAEKDVRYSDLRQQLAVASNAALVDLVFDNRRSIIELCLGLWFLAGTRRFPSDFMPQRSGALDEAIAVMRQASAPPDLIEACISVVSRTQWPLMLIFPMLYGESVKQPLQLRVHTITPTPYVSGIPVYGADQYTRIGKTCIRQLKAAVPKLLSFSTKQIGLALFYADGALIDRELTAPVLKEIQQASELADMQTSGLSLIGYDDLRHYLLENMSLLNDIRQKQLGRYVNAIQDKPTLTRYDGGEA